ncbi:Gfo/Idh/MocA family oxidoreductase [Alloalcanivorax marinus]|uniref:Gfo/Idh/MocA family oxidoreductase n=1 Tax=Alloalcanivorax marinus TaxID=1177169 RepID=UPI001933AD39|nr:Gfo/Idh/MocA family oxidoreductase [Alloalcanivorax marinus]MBL7250105.1 Gfo/Idh/MocA family oxidoreductase [Alloalcanivorax marinus]
MTDPLRIALIGEGAMGATHADTLARLDGARITLLVAKEPRRGSELARRHGIDEVTTHYETILTRRDLDAVILASPSTLHAKQALQAINAGLPCLVEIPAALNFEDCKALAAAQRRAGVPLMVAHSRRFSPAHRILREHLQNGRFHLQHLVSETYFFRRENLNMFGEPRDWTDNLLWHHACHSIDLFTWLLEGHEFDVWGQCGPPHSQLGIPMDMTVGMRSLTGGQLASMALSFNNRGPFGGFYRYIGEEQTYRVFRNTLTDSEDRTLTGNGDAFLEQDRAFLKAVRDGDTPESSIHSVLPAMSLLQRLQTIMSGQR